MKKATCTALCTVLLVALAGSVIHFRRASEGKDTDIMSSPSASNAAPDIRQMEKRTLPACRWILFASTLAYRLIIELFHPNRKIR